MKTFISITYTVNRYENRMNFIRKNGFSPTYTGAARMVARALNDDGRAVRVADISVCRVETMCLQ